MVDNENEFPVIKNGKLCGKLINMTLISCITIIHMKKGNTGIINNLNVIRTNYGNTVNMSVPKHTNFIIL